MFNRSKTVAVIAAFGLISVALGAPIAYAQSAADSKLTQTISAGTISTSFTDSSGANVANPSFTMTAATVSTTGNTTTTGSYGSTNSRATVDKPGLAGGFTLALAAKSPAIGWYANGTPSVSAYKHNGATPAEGQLTIGAGGTLARYVGSETGVTGSVGGTFNGTTPITIMAGSSAMDSVWRGYIYGISLSQIIPSGVPAGSYSIDLVQTATSV